MMTLIFGNLPEKRNEQMQQREISRKRRKAAQNATPDELLAQNLLNFPIFYDAITSVEIKRDLFQWQLRFRVSDPANLKPLTFTMSRNQVSEAQRILNSVLPARLKRK